MKLTPRSALLVLSGVALFTNPADAAVTLEDGSLAVAFYQIVSGVVQPNTYTFNLGQASNYRENAAYGVNVSTISGGPASGNIGADLANTFGANWADSGTVRWMVIGGVQNFASTVSGDPSATTYISRAASSLSGSGVSTTIPSISTFNRGILANNVSAFGSGVSGATQTAGVNPDGAIINIGAVNTVEDFVPPATLGLYFGQGVNPEQTLGGGTITNNAAFGNSLGTLEGALDIYRVINSTSGADLTAGYSNSPASVGSGQYIGTLVLGTDGNLSIVPEPSSALLGLAGTIGLCLRRRRNA